MTQYFSHAVDQVLYNNVGRPEFFLNERELTEIVNAMETAKVKDGPLHDKMAALLAYGAAKARFNGRMVRVRAD